MKNQFTPGPWNVERYDDNGSILVNDSSDLSRNIAAINNSRIRVEVLANARLIAAAPEMLVALEAMLDAFGVMRKAGVNVLGFDDAVEARIKAHAAIAKATGDI